VKILIGSDPEVFARPIGEKYCVPPIFFIQNNLLKVIEDDDTDHPVMYKDDKVKIISDGSAFEFNITPENYPDNFYNNFSNGVNILNEMLTPLGYEVYHSPIIPFFLEKIITDTALLSMYAFSCRFGCDPDIDIYSGMYSKSVDASKIKTRFGGGHIHINYPHNRELTEDIINQVKIFDILLGNTFVKNSPTPVEDKGRQKYYGRPGKIRLQSYSDGSTGIEYRTPSNSWLKSLESVTTMFQAVEKSLSITDIHDVINQYLNTAINNILKFNQKEAKALCEMFT